MEWPITYTRKIRYSDTDAQGIVFNGNYLTYLDDAMTDYFEALGTNWAEVHGQGFDLVAGHIEIDFRSPARLGETVVTGVKADEVGNTSLTFRARVWEAGGRTVAEAINVQVVVDATTLEKRPVPQLLIEGIERLQSAPLPQRGQR
ncbi:MAG: acyl-CoA thioesterase [Actinomycetota bacterium]